MQATETKLLYPDRANLVELAALLEDKNLKSMERRILQRALRETLHAPDHFSQGPSFHPLKQPPAELN